MRYASTTERLAGLGSDKWALHFAALERQSAGLPVLNLTIGEPDIPTPPGLIGSAVSALRAGRTGYSNGRGELVLLRALAARYGDRNGRPFGTDRFLCLPGTQTALYLALSVLCDPGSEVVLADPMYATYEGLIRAPGAVPVPVRLRPEQGFRLRAEDVARVLTPDSRVLFLNTPHNPTGAILRPSDLRALADLAAEHDLWILSDEVYGDLTHGAARFTSALADPAHEARTVVAASISKSHAAPGFRSGWLCGPSEFCARALPLSETMLFGTQPFIADMTATALTDPPDAALAMAHRMARRAGLVHEMLDGVAGMQVHRPEAGMFALIDIRALSSTSERFALALLKGTGVAVMPGASFGSGLEGWLRVALNVDDERTRDACALIGEFATSWQHDE